MPTLRRFSSTGLFALTIVLAIPGAVLAQTGAAALTGLVTDQSGAAVPGATVTATNQATSVEYTAVSYSESPPRMLAWIKDALRGL